MLIAQSHFVGLQNDEYSWVQGSSLQGMTMRVVSCGDDSEVRTKREVVSGNYKKVAVCLPSFRRLRRLLCTALVVSCSRSRSWKNSFFVVGITCDDNVSMAYNSNIISWPIRSIQ